MLRLSDKFKLENLSFKISSFLLSIEYENNSNKNFNEHIFSFIYFNIHSSYICNPIKNK